MSASASYYNNNRMPSTIETTFFILATAAIVAIGKGFDWLNRLPKPSRERVVMIVTLISSIAILIAIFAFPGTCTSICK